MWVEFVVGPLPCSERDFPGTPDFSPLLKNEHFQVPVRSGTAWKARTRLSSTPKCSVGKQTKNMTNLIAIDETTIFKERALAGKVYSHAMTAKKSTKTCDACFESLVYVFNYLFLFSHYECLLSPSRALKLASSATTNDILFC